MARFKLNLRPFKKLIRSLRRRPVDEAVGKQWLSRYSAFVRRRYKNQGDGEWKKLAPSTIAKRRKNSDVILRDTGTLLNALSVNAPGNFNKRIRRGVRFGFSKTKHTGGKRTMRQIAIWHETGAGRNPKRTILVEPNDKLVKSMGRDLRRSIERRGKRSGR